MQPTVRQDSAERDAIGSDDGLSGLVELYPQIIQAGVAREWVWLADGQNNSRFQPGMEPEEELTFLSQIVDTVEKGVGGRPKGWLGPALTETFQTPRLLAELGLSYVLDWCADDQSFPLRIAAGRAAGRATIGHRPTDRGR